MSLFRKERWLQYGTMYFPPSAIALIRETYEDTGPTMEVELVSGTTILLGDETADKWREWLKRNCKMCVVAKWSDIPNHPKRHRVKIFASDNPASRVLK